MGREKNRIELNQKITRRRYCTILQIVLKAVLPEQLGSFTRSTLGGRSLSVIPLGFGNQPPSVHFSSFWILDNDFSKVLVNTLSWRIKIEMNTTARQRILLRKIFFFFRRLFIFFYINYFNYIKNYFFYISTITFYLYQNFFNYIKIILLFYVLFLLQSMAKTINQNKEGQKSINS